MVDDPDEEPSFTAAENKAASGGVPNTPGPDAASAKQDETKSEKPEPSVAQTASGFLKTIGQGLKTAGDAAERYARIGVCMADLERLKLKLNSAHRKLGEAVVKCWDAAPDISVSSTESSIREYLLNVHDLRRRIREADKKIKSLQEQDQK